MKRLPARLNEISNLIGLKKNSRSPKSRGRGSLGSTKKRDWLQVCTTEVLCCARWELWRRAPHRFWLRYFCKIISINWFPLGGAPWAMLNHVIACWQTPQGGNTCSPEPFLFLFSSRNVADVVSAFSVDCRWREKIYKTPTKELSFILSNQILCQLDTVK